MSANRLLAIIGSLMLGTIGLAVSIEYVNGLLNKVVASIIDIVTFSSIIFLAIKGKE